jgi:DNA-binding LytR/AlgR family response regulator
MPTAIIADDEDLPRTELRSMLARAWPELEILAECEHGVDALEAIAQKKPDIAFLDIRMPGLTGLDVAHALSAGGGKCQIVFVTAYEQHALTAFGAGVVDYLLKPVGTERLQRTVARLRDRLAHPGAATLSPSALGGEIDRHNRPAEAARLRWISASAGDSIKVIPVANVLFFESDAKYTRVVTASDEAHIRMSLKELLAGLDPELFWQLNRGLLVRAEAIRRARRDELGRYGVELEGHAEVLKVSAAYSWRFRAM